MNEKNDTDKALEEDEEETEKALDKEIDKLTEDFKKLRKSCKTTTEALQELNDNLRD